MFYDKLNEGIILKNIIQSIKGLFDDLDLEISPEGIYIQKMVKSRISIACIKLPSQCFQEFKCEKSITTGISIFILEKVFNDIGDGDHLILKYDSPNKLIIELENPEINKISQYEIPLKKITYMKNFWY